MRCVRRHIADPGTASKTQQIGADVGMRSGASVHCQLIELEVKAAIVREPGRPRGIRFA
ncbi:hypothetical protein ABZ915_46795 [Streptomyces sp. NPDC046915]|uniref:LexA family protein n=1 Tax=Streptomyces sp. NPDC046915 TaxID=3155257 RepID=UPI0033C795A1